MAAQTTQTEEENPPMIGCKTSLTSGKRRRPSWCKGRQAWWLAATLASILLSVTTAYTAGYEVWLSDQANTQGFSTGNPNGTHGGKVVIYDGADLDQNPPVNNPLVLDATVNLFPNALSETGVHVARLHGILPSPDHRYMALNFVGSGHLTDRKNKGSFSPRAAAASPQPPARRPRAARRDTMLGAKAPVKRAVVVPDQRRAAVRYLPLPTLHRRCRAGKKDL
jgi:hypothetical protein